MSSDRGIVTFGSRTISFVIIRSRRRKKTMAVSLHSTGEVFVRAPFNLPNAKIVKNIQSKAAWIVEKKKQIESSCLHNKKEFVSGESFSYLGCHFRLKVLRNNTGKETTAKLRGGRLEVKVSVLNSKHCSAEIKSALKKWYSAHARKRISERVALYAGKMDIAEPNILIRDQQMRWGSCNAKGVLRFNWRIIMAPLRVVDYVVVHELCHLKHHDHSSAFWKSLRTIMPDYEIRKTWLRQAGGEMSL